MSAAVTKSDAQPAPDLWVIFIMKLFKRSNPSVDYAALSDAELVERAREDKLAFGELYERYVKRIYNYVYFRTGSPHDAEDLTARVFTRAMAHIGQYTDRGLPFQAWLYRIAHNLTANWHRDQGRRKVIPLEDYITGELAGESPDSWVEDEEELEALRAAVRRLPEDRQQLLLLKFVDGLSNAEIGQIMDKTEGAIKSLYHRTLTALRDEMQGRPSGDEEGDDLRRKAQR